MIELAQHIEALLLENDCVIVPGLGGFVAHYASATRVKEENIFILNLTFGSCRSLYGAKKIFYSTVGSYGVAWVVRG